MASGIDDIESRVAQTRQIDHIGPDEFDVKSESNSTAPGDIKLLLGDVDAGHLGSHPGQGENDLIVAAAEHRDVFASDIFKPFEFG
jgi:hypothetical protein